MPEYKSIYEYIKANIVDGKLPEDFSLNTCFDPEGINMVDGGLDGITIYHMVPLDITEDIIRGVLGPLTDILVGNFNEAYDHFAEILHKYDTISLIEVIQRTAVEVIETAMRSNANNFSPQALFDFAYGLMTGSGDREMVKLGLALTELGGEREDSKEIIRTLGACDEFTIFAAWNVRNWENGNNEVFELAKKANGWGRIHCIEMLQADTPEIKEWLLREGVLNGIMGEYSALTCFKKADVAKRLEQPLSQEEFDSITPIVGKAVCIYGPVEGLVAESDSKHAIKLYLERAKEAKLNLGAVNAIFEITHTSEEDENWADVASEAAELMSREDAVEAVMAAIAEGNGFELAEAMGLPYRDTMLERMENDFENNYYHCERLMDDPAYVDLALSVFRKNIPPEQIEDNPTEAQGFEGDFGIYDKLAYLLQGLKFKLPKGLDYILPSLTSPTIRNRTMCHRVLRCWVSEQEKPLEELSPEAFERLKYAYDKEPVENIKEAMLPLLNGETEFDESLM